MKFAIGNIELHISKKNAYALFALCWTNRYGGDCVVHVFPWRLSDWGRYERNISYYDSAPLIETALGPIMFCYLGYMPSYCTCKAYARHYGTTCTSEGCKA